MKQKLELMVDVPLRDVWEKEQSDFTPWLASNIDLLGEAIGVDLEVKATESYVGKFKADIWAQNIDTGRSVIIENQLEGTNHIHLGQSIVYAAGKDAELVIWIAKEVRAEHQQAVEWLNQHTDDTIGFFLIKVELKKIGDSKPAVYFNIIERPNLLTKASKYGSATDMLCASFWSFFNDSAFSEDEEFSKVFHLRTPDKQRYDLGIQHPKHQIIRLYLLPSTDQITVRGLTKENRAWYDLLKSHASEINAMFQEKVEWPSKEAKRMGFVVVKDDSPLKDENKWSEYVKWLKETALKVHEIFKKWPAPASEDEDDFEEEA